MNNYYYTAINRKNVDFKNIVLPQLIALGINTSSIEAMFNSRRLRVRWGKDWNNFTIHATNRFNEPTWRVDEDIHSLWNGINIDNYSLATCFINNKRLSSIAVTDLYTLTKAFKNYGIHQKTQNSNNGQTFITLPFSHFSLFSNIWGVGVRR